MQGHAGRNSSWDVPLNPDDEELGGAFGRAFRCRCLAMCAIQEALYRDRIRRGAKSRTKRVDATVFNPKDTVEFWTKPEHKDIPAWKGPATVVAVSEDGSSTDLRWQGSLKTLPPHLVRIYPFFAALFCGFLGNFEDGHEVYAALRDHLWKAMMDFGERVKVGH